MAKKVKRLFRTFQPSHYDLSITISEDKTSFNGKIIIKGRKTGRPSSRITLHQKELKIKNATVHKLDKNNTANELIISRIQTHKSYDEVRLHFEHTAYPAEYQIELDFSGKITKNMEGIYPCFFNDDGQDKRLIATQFESHHAREAFPCIDEPEAKATFKLKLTHAKNEIALSNTPIESEDEKNGVKTTIFENTPLMSTYLLAFVVGDLHMKEAKSKNGVKIRAFAVANQIENTDFALDVAVKSMDFYEDYYDIPFPLAKCDFVALPDFASGAMENWGLITFREQALLCDKDTSLASKQWVAIVVAHELTHQWFGNLVTMRWWTDLWLNEGFASWMEYLAIDKLFPEWQLWTQFSVDEQQTALRADALEHTHPIEVAVKHPDEIRTIFDIISYQKGASVIHMLNDYLGPDSFRDGLRYYLKKYSYKNTDTIDLWQALEDVTKKPVKEFMGSWTSQSGFPLLEVSLGDDHLKVSQKRFVSNPTSKARADKTLWPIPLFTEGLSKDTVTKKVNNIPFIEKTNHPISLNTGQTGFYRVSYSSDMRQMQLKALDQGKMQSIDRMGLLSDGFEVTKAGYAPISDFLNVLEHFGNEDNLVVWEVISSSIGAIKISLTENDENDELREIMKPFIKKLVQKQLNRLTWDEAKSENHLDTLLRPLIIAMSAGADDEKTIKIALEKYSHKIHDNLHINPDIKSTVFSTAARKGGEKEFQELLKLYKKTQSADEKLIIAGAMTSFEQPEIHKKTFKLITDGTVKLQDVGYWIAYSFMNRHSREASWEWLKDNWQWLKDNLGNDLSFSRTPVYIARSFNTEKQLEDYKKFFNANMEPMLERSYNQGLEIIESSSAWRSRDRNIAIEWFKSRLD